MLRPARRPNRTRQRLRAGVLTLSLLVGTTGGASLLWQSRHVTLPLLSQTVALTADGGRTVITTDAPDALLPGTRVLTPSSPSALPEAQRLADDQRRWLESGSVPGAGTAFEPMVRAALLDLNTLTLESGAALAGGHGKWRYVWPRDASFTAVALARTGHLDDAFRVLQFVAGLQSDDGSFQARYLPDGSGPPDARGVQEDGVGWVLWATAQVLDEVPRSERVARAAPLLGMVDRSSTRVLALTSSGTQLPPPASDYWEVRETSLTLGTVAPMLAGLGSAAGVYADVGQPARAARLSAAALRLRVVVERTFGARGYPRHVDGVAVDAALTFVLPPFQPVPLAGALELVPHAVRAMSRPAGGLAPGEGWKRDGVSWTPETALFALAAASTGQPAEAKHWLTWLSQHRTSAGSLPEKVLSGGEPAAVAPLAWTAAVVVLAVAALDEAQG